MECHSGQNWSRLFCWSQKFYFRVEFFFSSRNFFPLYSSPEIFFRVEKSNYSNREFFGETYVRGALTLRARGVYIERWKIRESLHRMIPVNRAIRRRYRFKS